MFACRASSQQVRDRRIALGIIVGTIVGGSFVFGGDDKKAPEPGKPFGFDADGTRIERNTEGRQVALIARTEPPLDTARGVLRASARGTGRQPLNLCLLPPKRHGFLIDCDST